MSDQISESKNENFLEETIYRMKKVLFASIGILKNGTSVEEAKFVTDSSYLVLQKKL